MGTKKPQRKPLDTVAVRALEKKMFLIVKGVVDQFDPESLLKLGCPKDEYDGVSSQIARSVIREYRISGFDRTPSITEAANMIALSLHVDFGMWSKPLQYHSIHFEMAKVLVAALK